MDLNQKTYEDQACILFDKMQEIIEARPVALIESYEKDFYEFDKTIISQIFSNNARYLWLIHQCGTHFGRIGILPDENDMMKAALKCYESAYDEDKMELYSIKTDAMGNSEIKKINFKEGYIQIAKKDYIIIGNTMMNGSSEIAKIDVKTLTNNNGQYGGHIKISSIEKNHLDREKIIAAVINGTSIVVKQSNLFTPIKEIMVDNVNVDNLIPVLAINDVEYGKYNPKQINTIERPKFQ